MSDTIETELSPVEKRVELVMSSDTLMGDIRKEVLMTDGVINFQVSGDPQGKGRARSFIRAGHVAHYTPANTRSYEGMIRYAAQEAMSGHEIIRDPVEVGVHAVFGIPASYSNKKRLACLSGEIKPGKKPDLDNIAKAVTDACNAVVFTDDSLIVRMALQKVYGAAPMVVIAVKLA